MTAPAGPGIPIVDADGRIVAKLRFTPTHPGAELRRILLWPSLSLSVAFITLLVFAHLQAATERIKLIESEARATHLALHDQLTGLANRRYLLEALENEIGIADVEGSPVSLLIVDLDRFKHVNDTFGHDCGDELIRQVADRLRSVCDEHQAFCARLGGDEFVILASRCPPSTAARLADEVLIALSRPVRLSTAEVRIGGSIGVACYHHGGEPGTLLRAADDALYRAKREGRNTYRLSTIEIARSPMSRPTDREKAISAP